MTEYVGVTALVPDVGMRTSLLQVSEPAEEGLSPKACQQS